MAETSQLRGRHGDDPCLDRREEVGVVECAELGGGNDQAGEEFREGFAEFFEDGEFGG